MPQHNENTSGTPNSVSRRSVVKAAAWSAPAVALAVGAPAFAASGAKITVDFVAVGLKLHHSTSLSVLVSITNSGSIAVSDTAHFDVSNIPTDLEVGYDPDDTTYTAPADSNTTTTPVNNKLFVLADHAPIDTTYSFVSAGPLTIAAKSTVYFFFTITWPAHNVHTGGFVIAGSFTFGTGALLQSSSNTVSIDYVEDAPG